MSTPLLQKQWEVAGFLRVPPRGSGLVGTRVHSWGIESARAQHLRAAVGCRLLFLPPYSPDFNPIEPIFAKVKTALRAAAAGDRDRPLEAPKAAFDAVTPADAAACYADWGLPLPLQPF